MNRLIAKIGLDKFAHLGIGGLICALFTFVVILQDADILLHGSNIWRALLTPFIGTVVVMVFELALLTPFIGTVVVMVFELFKEYMDSEFNWKDVLWTFIGCLLVFAAVGMGILFYVLSN